MLHDIWQAEIHGAERSYVEKIFVAIHFRDVI